MGPTGSPLSTEQHGGEGVGRVGCWEGGGGEGAKAAHGNGKLENGCCLGKASLQF